MNAKSIFGLLLLLLCASCQRDECIIRGVITEVADGDYMYLSDYLGKEDLDSAEIKGGKFEFRIPRASEEDFLPKVVSSYSNKNTGTSASVAMVFTQDAEVAYIRTKEQFEVTGSPYNDLFREVSLLSDSIDRLLGKETNLLLKDKTLTPAQKDSIGSRISTLKAEYQGCQMRYIEENIDNVVGAYLLYISARSMDAGKLKYFLDRLPAKFAASPYFAEIRESADRKK